MSSTIRQTGKIISRSGRKYSLELDSGGMISAESGVSYPVGIRVVVLAGVIVDRAGAKQKVKYFQV